MERSCVASSISTDCASATWTRDTVTVALPAIHRLVSWTQTYVGSVNKAYLARQTRISPPWIGRGTSHPAHPNLPVARLNVGLPGLRLSICPR